jgi:uncharacterized protein YegP (UPF0339 family)
MATATKQAPRQRGQRAVDGVSSEFVVFQSNSGEYRWEIVDERGATLAQSASFASFDAAQEAAIRVRNAAGPARREARGAGESAPARGRKAVAIGRER